MLHPERLVERIKRVLYQLQGEHHLATVVDLGTVWDDTGTQLPARAYQITRQILAPDGRHFEVWGRPVGM